jgi:hypothetical protein
MRTFIALGLVLLALAPGCGGEKKPAKEDAGIGNEGQPMIDAPVLATCANPVAGEKIAFRRIGRVVGGAMLATAPPGDDRLFVIEQRGAIRIFKNEALTPDPFIDLSIDNGGTVLAGGEQVCSASRFIRATPRTASSSSSTRPAFRTTHFATSSRGARSPPRIPIERTPRAPRSSRSPTLRAITTAA